VLLKMLFKASEDPSTPLKTLAQESRTADNPSLSSVIAQISLRDSFSAAAATDDTHCRTDRQTLRPSVTSSGILKGEEVKEFNRNEKEPGSLVR
jgi:hypothetical protein